MHTDRENNLVRDSIDSSFRNSSVVPGLPFLELNNNKQRPTPLSSDIFKRRLKDKIAMSEYLKGLDKNQDKRKFAEKVFPLSPIKPAVLDSVNQSFDKSVFSAEGTSRL